jgi:hypothetical protein
MFDLHEAWNRSSGLILLPLYFWAGVSAIASIVYERLFLKEMAYGLVAVACTSVFTTMFIALMGLIVYVPREFFMLFVFGYQLLVIVTMSLLLKLLIKFTQNMYK